MNRLGIGLAGAALLCVSSCGGSGSDGSATSKKFDVSGTVSLIAVDDIATGNNDGPCRGVGDHNDLKPGAQVVVFNPDGKRVGLGSLDAGTTGTGDYCDFPFTVTGVPASDGVYTVEVAGQEKVSFKQADAADVKVTID